MRPPRPPRLLVITGLSGSGKTHVSRALEDAGWFCVDNLPTALVPSFADLIRGSAELRRSALVVDVRERGFPERFPGVYRSLKRRGGLATSLVFLEADERTLLRRFSETRRPHPLAGQEPAIEGIRAERTARRASRSARIPSIAGIPSASGWGRRVSLKRRSRVFSSASRNTRLGARPPRRLRSR